MPRRKLADGEWVLARADTSESSSRLTVRSASTITRVELTATDRDSGDVVVANITVGDLAGYEMLEDLGIPASVATESIWCLQRVEPRAPRVAGGTKAILRELCRLADLKQAWVHTEVKPVRVRRTAGIIRLLGRYGFETAPFGQQELLCRRPG